MNIKEEIKNLKNKIAEFDAKVECNDAFDTYTIAFNGKEEVWHASKEEMNHGDAMCACEAIGKTAPKLVELLEEDETGKNRIELLNEAGLKSCVWCKAGPFVGSWYAYDVELDGGGVSLSARNNYTYAVCR